ncbi:hypothetical protein OB955_09235 [Halobacteria archaeon AArc-m2/3/4]|uniref:Envelope protein N-terminal domain-containing protein n=1 Tax=Natronoglomus mannanivorans TaxID=2979990 RepID=A0ABT2QDC1_9EURY|nr:hypothetical protein [Halobacteria archaeon AArc-m2/3/4]
MSSTDDSSSGPTPMPTAHTSLGDCDVCRRQVLRGIGTGALAIGAASSGVVAQDNETDDGDDEYDFDDTGDRFHFALMHPGAAAVSGFQTLLSGRNPLSTSSSAHGESLWDQIYATGVEMEAQRTSALGSIENDAEMLAQYLRLDVATAIVETAEQEETDEQDTEDAALEVLETEVANLETNLYNYWTVDYLAMLRRVWWFLHDDTGDINAEDAFMDTIVNPTSSGVERHQFGSAEAVEELQHLETKYEDILDNAARPEDAEDDVDDFDWMDDTDDMDYRGPYARVVLASGDEVNIPTNLFRSTATDVSVGMAPFDLSESDILMGHESWHTRDDDSDWMSDLYDILVAGSEDLPDRRWSVGVSMYERETEDEEIPGRVDLLDARPFLEAHNRIREAYTQESGNIATMVDNLYDLAADGAITSDEIASGTAIRDAAEDGDDWQAAAGYYRAVGMSEADAPARYEIGDVEAVGKLF